MSTPMKKNAYHKIVKMKKIIILTENIIAWCCKKTTMSNESP